MDNQTMRMGDSKFPGDVNRNTRLATFVFTDVEGSTRLWDLNPDLMAQCLEKHDEIISLTCEEFRGQHVLEQGEGDSHFCVFDHVGSAILAALTMQSRLEQLEWPDSHKIQVRIGIHSGEARLRAYNFYGPNVNRSARIRACAHGGQVIVSKATYELAKSVLRDEVEFKYLGCHRLKDLLEPEQIYQVSHPGEKRQFPSLRSLERTSNNLPIQLSAFVGREQDIVSIRELIEKKRLVTVTGTGGAGKTRLSIQVAAEIADQFTGGVWFVDLTLEPTAQDALKEIADTLGVKDTGQDPTQEIARSIGTDQVLLILDNCEHLATPLRGVIEELLRTCPGARILATSRSVFQLSGEQVYRVPGLSFPTLEQDLAYSNPRSFEAVRLFIERAEDLDPSIVFTEAELLDICAICRQLDGLPLAIELAAAKTRILKVEKIRSRLKAKFDLLASGRSQIPQRHETIRTAIEHSYQLLNENDRRAFEELSIFEGSWSLEAAEAVLGAAGIPDPLYSVQSLYDSSLLTKDSTGQANRYRFLETIKAFGKEVGHPSESAVAAFASYYRELAQNLGATYKAGEVGGAVREARVDHANFTSAIHTLASLGGWEDAAETAYALRDIWLYESRLEEGAKLFASLVASKPDQPTALGANTCNVSGVFAWSGGDLELARECLFASLDIWTQLGDEAQIGNVSNNLGLLASSQELYEEAGKHFQKSLDTARARGDQLAAAKSLTNLGAVALDQGEFDAAKGFFESALEELGSTPDEVTEGTLLANIAFASVANHDADAANRLRTAIEFELDHERIGLAYRLLLVSAEFARQVGDTELASSLLRSARVAHVETQAPWRRDETRLLRDLESNLDLGTASQAPLGARQGLERILELDEK